MELSYKEFCVLHSLMLDMEDLSLEEKQVLEKVGQIKATMEESWSRKKGAIAS